VNLGHRPSFLFGEEYLSALIHFPLSGRLIGLSVVRVARATSGKVRVVQGRGGVRGGGVTTRWGEQQQARIGWRERDGEPGGARNG
jgi:hypothetical protein